VGIPWQNCRLSYRQLSERSKSLAKSMLEAGLQHGDCVGIMAGNCYQYIEVFLGAGRIGCPVVVLNNTYSPAELSNAASASCTFVHFLSQFFAHLLSQPARFSLWPVRLVLEACLPTSTRYATSTSEDT
jgi:acyl-CoA synthetase (AMP-forming)/AMP-acid ligase II